MRRKTIIFAAFPLHRIDSRILLFSMTSTQIFHHVDDALTLIVLIKLRDQVQSTLGIIPSPLIVWQGMREFPVPRRDQKRRLLPDTHFPVHPNNTSGSSASLDLYCILLTETFVWEIRLWPPSIKFHRAETTITTQKQRRTVFGSHGLTTSAEKQSINGGETTMTEISEARVQTPGSLIALYDIRFHNVTEFRRIGIAREGPDLMMSSKAHLCFDCKHRFSGFHQCLWSNKTDKTLIKRKQ